MTASPEVTFRDAHGAELKPWQIHAGLMIVEIDYDHGDGSLICVVRAEPAVPEGAQESASSS